MIQVREADAGLPVAALLLHNINDLELAEGATRGLI